VVVSDRFVSSSVAYQGFAGGIEPALIWEMGRVAAGGIEPDLTILLDLDVETGFARIARPHDRMESKDRAYHEKVRQGFRTMARERPDRFVVVDASRAPDAVARDISSAVKRVLR
jgi:dTMP kinase